MRLTLTSYHNSPVTRSLEMTYGLYLERMSLEAKAGFIAIAATMIVRDLFSEDAAIQVVGHADIPARQELSMEENLEKLIKAVSMFL